MPKKNISCVFLPRRKEGEDPDVPRHISVTYESLERLFHLPLKEAAREIGLCPTTFKKVCRRFDLETWPFRNASSSLAGQCQAPIARGEAQTDGVDAAKVACTSPVWHGGSSSLGFPVSSDASSSSNVRASSFQLKTFAPNDAPSYIDTFTRGRVVIGAPLPTPEGVAPVVGMPTTEACGMAQGGATPLEAGPPGEKSCSEAVMEYLDLGCSISEADVTSMLSNDY